MTIKKASFVAFLVLLCLGSVIGQVRYATYTNDRWGFSIDYPTELLRMQPPPANDDGRIFRSSDGSVEMRASGAYNSLDRSVKESFSEAVGVAGIEPVYKTIFKDGYAFSGYKGSNIVYWRTWRRLEEDSQVDFTFTILYPRSNRKLYDPIVKRIVRSFTYNPRGHN